MPTLTLTSEYSDSDSLCKAIMAEFPFLCVPDVLRAVAVVGQTPISDICLVEESAFTYYLTNPSIKLPGVMGVMQFRGTLLFSNAITKDKVFASMMWVQVVFSSDGKIKNRLMCCLHYCEHKEWV